MAFSLSHLFPLALELMCLLSLAQPFTVIMSDSGVPSTLVDGPQTEFSMNKIGARTNTHEQEAVYDVMRATGNDWAADIPDVCRGRWHGIECMPDKDNVYHVVSLSFGALSDDTAFPACDPIRSYISPSITKLPHIRTLFFYRCFSDNSQAIPSFLGQLGSSLQTLVLRENGHVGPIPSELGNLTRLRVLDLHKNNLEGSIPTSMGRISGLKSLDLSGNKLTGSIPGLVFPELNIIDLNQNLLTGPIPPSIGACHSLIKIDFSRNRLSSSLPDSITGMKNLMLLDLSYNQITGPFPESLKGLTSLQALNLMANPIASISSDVFDGATSLMTIILSGMNLQGPIPLSLSRLPGLRVLHLDGNGFNGSIPPRFKDMKDLKELRLNDNCLTGPIPFGREMAWRMKTKLRLYNNSGLCYDLSSGFEEGLDPSFNPGTIRFCGQDGSGSARVVEHLDLSKNMDSSSSSESTCLVLMRLVTLLMWFTLQLVC